MKRWSDFKVQSKLMVLIAVVCLTLVIVGGMGLTGMLSSNSSLEKANKSTEQVALLGQIKSDFLTMRLDLVSMMALTDEAKLKERYADFELKTAWVQEALKRCLTFTAGNAGETNAIKIIAIDIETYVTNGRKLGDLLLAAHAAHDPAAITAAVKYGGEQVAPQYIKPAEAVASLVDAHIKEAQQTYSASKAVLKQLSIVLLTIVGTSFIIALAIGGFISSTINRSLQQILVAMKALANGDLTVRCSIRSLDEMGQLAVAVNEMADRINPTISVEAQNGSEAASVVNELHLNSEQTCSLSAQEKQIAVAADEHNEITTDFGQIVSVVQLTVHNSQENAATAA